MFEHRQLQLIMRLATLELLVPQPIYQKRQYKDARPCVPGVNRNLPTLNIRSENQQHTCCHVLTYLCAMFFFFLICRGRACINTEGYRRIRKDAEGYGRVNLGRLLGSSVLFRLAVLLDFKEERKGGIQWHTSLI